jgi:hypothetical protein
MAGTPKTNNILIPDVRPMSLVTRNGRISVKPFTKVPPLVNLPGILPTHASVSNVSSNSRVQEGGVDLSEGCLVTKSLKYTHQLIHWINAIRTGDPTEVVSRHKPSDTDADAFFIKKTLLQTLHIVPYPDFTLDDPCNLALRKS